jgi:UDP-glucose 4-epimerase
VISTSGLAREIARSLKKENRLFCLPGMKKVLRKWKPSLYERLFADFELDNRRTMESLQWKPPYSFEEGVNEMMKWYLNNA